MRVPSIPSEILARIIHESVLVRTLRRAMRLRLVSREFALHTNAAIFRSDILDCVFLRNEFDFMKEHQKKPCLLFFQNYFALRAMKDARCGSNKWAVNIGSWMCKVLNKGDEHLFECVNDLCGMINLAYPGHSGGFFERGVVEEAGQHDLKIKVMIYLGLLSHVRNLLVEEQKSKASDFDRTNRFRTRLELAASCGNREAIQLLVALEPEYQSGKKLPVFTVSSIIGNAASGGYSDVFNLAIDWTESLTILDHENRFWTEFFDELFQASRIIADPRDYKRIVDIFGPDHVVFSRQLDGHVASRIETSAYWGRVEMVRSLLQRRSFGINDPAGRPSVHLDNTESLRRPLLNGVERGSLEIVSMLLDYGTDPNDFEERETALMVAVKKGKLDIVRLLVERGADVNAGRPPPIVLAVDQEDMKVCQYLREVGAKLNAPETVKLVMRTVEHFGLDSMRSWWIEATGEGKEIQEKANVQVSNRLASVDEVTQYPLLFNHLDKILLESVLDGVTRTSYLVRQMEIGKVEKQPDRKGAPRAINRNWNRTRSVDVNRPMYHTAAGRYL